MKYDIHTTCPLCGQSISWINGKNNSNIVMIKTKRKATRLYHESCIDQERNHNKRGSENG